jgi:proteasome inhibitor subunit 1 (PI31)
VRTISPSESKSHNRRLPNLEQQRRTRLSLVLSLFPSNLNLSSMSVNILDPAALCSLLPTLLPPTSKKLNSSHDGIAALVHAALSALAFRLIAIDESSTALSSSSNVLPELWNQHGPGNYTFKYRHDQSSLEFVVKIIKLGARTLINAIAVEV